MWIRQLGKPSLVGIGNTILSTMPKVAYGLLGNEAHTMYKFSRRTDQYIHCYTTQMNTHTKFFITFVYGMNKEQQRESLWSGLLALAQHIS